MPLTATYYGSNGWLLEFDDFRILVDPWLRDSLKFKPGAWLFEGKLPKKIELPKGVDLVLLTQGLADHSHPPTLKSLPKSIPVIGSSTASTVCKDLGFLKVSTIHPGDILQINDLKIEATAGASVPRLENGYLLNHPSGAVYLEPHGYLDPKITPQQIDAAITPVIDIKLPLFGAFVRGKSVLPDLINRLNPLTVLCSTAGGNASYSGLIQSLIQTDGSPTEILETFSEKTFFIDPVPETPYALRTRTYSGK